MLRRGIRGKVKQRQAGPGGNTRQSENCTVDRIKELNPKQYHRAVLFQLKSVVENRSLYNFYWSRVRRAGERRGRVGGEERFRLGLRTSREAEWRRTTEPRLCFLSISSQIVIEDFTSCPSFCLRL